MSDSKEIKFDTPVEHDGESVASVVMRPMKLRDYLVMTKLKKTDAEKEIEAIANLCEVDVELLHELEMPDYFKLQKEFDSFLEVVASKDGEA